MESPSIPTQFKGGYLVSRVLLVSSIRLTKSVITTNHVHGPGFVHCTVSNKSDCAPWLRRI